MKLFTCAKCGNLLYFENTVCLNCNSPIGFDAFRLTILTLTAAGNGSFENREIPGEQWRYCANATYAACNWLIPLQNPASYCVACQLNRTIPNLGVYSNLENWRRTETAKHRLIYSLLRVGLPVTPKRGTGPDGIAFDMLADADSFNHVITGHEDGTITLNIEEADEASRTRHKLDLGERYRTLLGHLRHEIGHYYWDLFFNNNENGLGAFRALFGDERKDYANALKVYYQSGASADWNEHFISPYASSHPWEDWAESWSHYLHLMDTLETAYSFGIAVNPRKVHEPELHAEISRDPYTLIEFQQIIRQWLPLTFAVNSLNRGMGHPDFYPFIISPAVVKKLEFIHGLVKNGTPQ